jgi:hypothetical protein
VFALSAVLPESTPCFDFSRYLFGPAATLTVSIEEIDPETGHVLINGGDSQQPSIPFTWIWGDGNAEAGWFPMAHTYGNIGRNYVVKVAAHYEGGGTDTAYAVVMFVAPAIDPISLPSEVTVSVPDSEVALGTHWPGYLPPDGLTGFGSSFFGVIPRSTVEYVLSLASFVEMDFVDGDVYRIGGEFPQVVQRDSTFGGMFSLWFTNPISFVSGDGGLAGDIQWSSFLHEMGHNFTLNAPCGYHYGGRIDGGANAIYSETMAQVFQHAAAYELINGAPGFGLGEDLAAGIRMSAVQSIGLVRDSYDEYVATGHPFASWNDPGTPEDETFLTFMTLAYTFFAHAEAGGAEYRAPAKSMLTLLRRFDSDWEGLYDHLHDTAEADTFRATLLVTAMSYGFGEDLRGEFRGLGFPISDAHYEMLMGSLSDVAESLVSPTGMYELHPNIPNPFNPTTTIRFSVPVAGSVAVTVHDIAGRRVATLAEDTYQPGTFTAVWNGRDDSGSSLPSGVYFTLLSAGEHTVARKIVLIRRPSP